MSTASVDRIRVLHVDDAPDFAETAAAFLEREDARITVETAADASEGLERLATGAFDCVVSDYDMPGRDGIEFLEAVRTDWPDLPFVLFTGKGSEAVASDAISAGVTDYLQKESGTDQYTVLANRIANAVEHYRSRQEVERSEKRLRSIVDSLPHLLFVVDADGRYVLGNEALAEFHGLDVSAIEGTPVEAVLDDPLAEQFIADLEEVVESGEPKQVPEVEMCDAEGEPRVLEPRLFPYDLAETEGRAVLGFAVDVTDRRERERELDRVRDRMALALEQTQSVVFEVDLETDAVVRHGTYEESFDVAPETAPTWQDHCERAVHPEDRAAFRQFHRELIDGDREDGVIEYRTNPETGPVRWMRAAIDRADRPDSDGRHAVGISRDVTEHKERERELERTNALLSTLFNTLPVGVVAEDASRSVLTANQQLFDLFGIDGAPDDIAGADCRRLAEEVSDLFADPEGFVRRTDDLVAAREPVRDEHVELADGRTFARSHEPVELADEDGHLWVYRDVTERVEYETRLEALSETTRELMTADTETAVAETGAEAARDVLGLEANGVYLHDEAAATLEPVAVTEEGYDLFGDPPTFSGGDSVAWRAFEAGDPVAREDVHEDPDVYDPDSPIHGELHLPIGDRGVLIAGSETPAAFDQQDVALGEILAGNVATALEQVERTAELRARERELTRQNERLEEFASIVSHDLRNPLTVAVSRLELAMRDCESAHLDAVDSALDRMDRLIRDLLTLARQGDRVSDLAPVAVDRASREAWRNVETGDATLEIAAGVQFEADRTRLVQLLENLFRNAVEHGGPAVTVTVGETDEPTGFYVADDGPGIAPADRESVFEAGFSTARDGTGFGLSIVAEIADAHGWAIEVTDSNDGGACFRITGVDAVD